MAKYDGIYKRPDGRFCYELYLGKTDTGKQRKKYIYGRSKAEVYDKVQEARAALARGVDVSRKAQSVQQFLEYWLEHHVKRRNAANTYTQYASCLKHHVYPAIGTIPLEQLHERHVTKMLRELQPHKAHKNQKALKPISGNTRRIIRSVLRAALNVAKRESLVSANVAENIEVDVSSTFEAHPLTDKEAQKLLEAIEGHRQAAMYLLYVSVGFRRGELLAVQWQHIDLENGFVRVAGSLGRVGGKLRVGATKTPSSQQTLPLAPFVVQALLLHREQQQTEGCYSEDGFVFVSEKCTPLEPRNVNRQFKALLKKAGLPQEVRIHDLRHTCGSLLAAKQVDQRTIMRLLRHTQMSTTTRYVHPYEEAQRRALEGLGDMLKKKKE